MKMESGVIKTKTTIRKLSCAEKDAYNEVT